MAPPLTDREVYDLMVVCYKVEVAQELQINIGPGLRSEMQKIVDTYLPRLDENSDESSDVDVMFYQRCLRMNVEFIDRILKAM